MKRSNRCPYFFRICLVFFSVIILCRIHCAQAFSTEKIYGSDNWQELEDIAPPFLVNWVKKGEFILKASNLNFDFSIEKDFFKASQENAGKFDVDEKGFIVEIGSKKKPKFIYSFPFPEIDSKAPNAGEHVMHNYKYGLRRLGGDISPYTIMLIGENRLEREIKAADKTLYYQGHPDGPFPNPDNLLRQYMSYFAAPMEYKGMVEMGSRYNDERPDVTVSYVASLRKVMRTTSNASRSNPGMGSDMCSDDWLLWAGKNATFTWSLAGEMEVLSCFTTPKPISLKDELDGTIRRMALPLKIGFEVSDWKGAPWAPVDVIWSLRPVWIVKGLPKDPEYNYGRHIFYVDQKNFIIWYKEVYNKLGEYCKGMFLIQSYQVASSQKTNLFRPDAHAAVNANSNHASFAKNVETLSSFTDTMYIPLSLLGPDNYNLNVLQQLSK